VLRRNAGIVKLAPVLQLQEGVIHTAIKSLTTRQSQFLDL